MKKNGLEHQGTSTYLVYELEEGDAVDSMSLGMLMNNQIPGFAKTIYLQMDNTRQVKYDITAKLPATQYLLGKINKKRLIGVFRGIVNAFLVAEDYMIDERTIQLDLSCIFSDVATAETVLICLPVAVDNMPQPDYRSFFKEIIINAEYDDRENQNYVAKIMSYLNGTPTFSLPEFKNLLEYLVSEPSNLQTAQVPSPQVAQQATESAQAAFVEIPASQLRSNGSPTSAGSKAPEQNKQKREESRVAVPQPANTSNSVPPEDQISLFYLLQHYNKDNAAAYKAQKEAKKALKDAEKAKKEQKKTQEPEPKKSKKDKTSFSVPGQTDHPLQSAGTAPQVPHGGQPMYSGQAMYVGQQVPAQQPMYGGQQVPAQQPMHGGQQFQTNQIQSGADDETSILIENDDETVIMGFENQRQRLIPQLIRKRNNERIPINQSVFRLGRDSEYNDYAVVDNRHVGHSHCHIVCRDGEYFIVDDNSKNHTKINGEVIPSGVEVKLSHDTVLSLADEEFEFKLY